MLWSYSELYVHALFLSTSLHSSLKLVAKKTSKPLFFGQKWWWFDGGFSLSPGCVFLVNLELAWSQRFDLVGSLGDILGYLPSKFEGPSWSGLVTVGLWSQICATAKRRKKWYRKSHKRRISPAPRMLILTHELFSDARSITVQHLFASQCAKMSLNEYCRRRRPRR